MQNSCNSKKKKDNKHNRKWINDMNMGFTEKEIYVIKKHVQRYSVSVVIKEK